jgi:hypothetical protein
MRLAYGVFVHGRGHATRALAVLPELQERHEVVVLVGGDAQRGFTAKAAATTIPRARADAGAVGGGETGQAACSPTSRGRFSFCQRAIPPLMLRTAAAQRDGRRAKGEEPLVADGDHRLSGLRGGEESVEAIARHRERPGDVALGVALGGGCRRP